MQLTQLRIAGFKSFVEPEQIPIKPGLTGIVGPNGCGKSNVLEALRWVMGANSAKAMRGGEMDDLIFSGAAGRPAREMVEVTLVLDNSKRTAPAEYNMSDTLEVMRRMKRGAGSRYTLNGKTVRAKDIRLLFADAATGANSPSLVRQGQISELINAKPQNRRRILEEAAGISGINARRHETELKLQAAQDNLERLADLSSGLEQQIKTLKRQAKKAVQYKKLSSNITAFEAFLAYLKWQIATKDKEAEAVILARARDEYGRLTRDNIAMEEKRLAVDQKLAVLRKHEQTQSGQLAETRIEIARVETAHNNTAGLLQGLEREAQRLSENIEREQAGANDARQALDKARSVLAALPVVDEKGPAGKEAEVRSAREKVRAALKQAERDVDRISADLARKNAEIKALKAGAEARRCLKERLENEAKQARATLEALLKTAPPADAADAAHGAVAEAETALRDIDERVEAMETASHNRQASESDAKDLSDQAQDALRTAQTEIAGLTRLSSNPEAAFSEQPVITQIQVREGYEQALATALGDDLQASTDCNAAFYWAGGACPDQALPTPAKPLSDFVTAPGVLAARLSQCGLVSAPDDGKRLAGKLRPGQRLVTCAGHLWRWDGFTRMPGSPDAMTERLKQQDRLKKARAKLDSLQQAAKTHKHDYIRAKNERIRSEDELKALRRKAQDARIRRDETHQALVFAIKTADQNALKIENARYTCTRLETELEVAVQAFTTAAKPENHDRLITLETDLAQAQSAVIRERDRETGLNDLIQNCQQAVVRRTLLEQDITRCKDRLETALEQANTLIKQRAHLDGEIAKARARPQALRAQLDTLISQAESLEAKLKSTTDALACCTDERDQAERDVRSVSDRVTAVRETMAGAGARLENASLRLDETVDIARTQFNSRPETLLQLAGNTLDAALLEHKDPARIEREINDLRDRRSQLGGINMEAEADLADLTTHLDERAAEKADLSAAIVKLREGVSTLHETGRNRLKQAFEQVNGHFKMLFAILFDGGEAELRLVEADDPMAVGLEIFAQPPGKRLGQLSLMSGGEQALTATALIFAVFLSSPSPVCVLDEVDAPLDDANVDRFCRMLHEMRKLTDTRFIVITHNPITMSRMDRLFGVTMREKGVSRFVSVNLQTAEPVDTAA